MYHSLIEFEDQMHTVLLLVQFLIKTPRGLIFLFITNGRISVNDKGYCIDL